MSNSISALLVVSNIITAGALFHYYDLDRQHSETRTTDLEREQFGQGCLDWMSEQGQEAITGDDTEGPSLWLGRSWRKHGQMVFEIFSDPDAPPEKMVNVLCTYDQQSGTMFAFEGMDRNMWMFY